MTPSFREDHSSHLPTLQLLLKLGYTYLSPEEALALRGNKSSNVILEEVLRKQLKEINSIKVSSVKTSFFSDANIENGILGLKDLPMNEGYMAACSAAYDLLSYGKALEQNIDGDKKSFTLQYIDWQHPERNVFHVTEEYQVMKATSKEHFRPDIVLFVNGIPLCVIECKRPDMDSPLDQAISQHLRNQNEDGIRRLYVYTQLTLSLALLQAKYATTDTKEKYWSKWTEQYTSTEEEKVDRAFLYKLVNTRLKAEQSQALLKNRLVYEREYILSIEKTARAISLQDEYVYYLCRPERILDLSKNFILFDAGVKKITRYQQYFAIKKITKRIQTFEGGRRKGGVIWHTQGSGKSLTMALLARAIAQQVQNPKIVLVTDRIDLDSQITKTFEHVDVPVINASTGNALADLLKSKSDAVITTIINKFEAAVNQLKAPLESSNIFVLIDEGHRTQYGTFNVKMQKTLPNACFLAFTGTPLMKSEKSTATKFGGIIDAYTVMQAVADGAVVPIMYEGRHAVQDVNREAIDRYFSKVAEPLSEYQRADLKKKFSKADQINKTEQRIHNIAWDIVDHYNSNWGEDKTGERSGFKGMVVCPDKLTAVRYKEMFDQIGRVSTEVIMSPPDVREGFDDPYSESSDKVVAYWKKMESKHGRNFETGIINQFKNSEEPELIIVVDKLLTGFDEPRVIVMYVCRKLREHTLLQAIARVNRVASGKDYGFIIDYEGIIGELDDALETYSELAGFEPEDLEGTLTNIEEEIAKLPQIHSDLHAVFKTLLNKMDLVGYAALLSDEAIRTDFYVKLTAYARVMKIALSSLAFENDTAEKTRKKYKEDLKFFVNLRNAVVNEYSDRINFKQYEKQLQKLLDQHVTTLDVIRLTDQVDILNQEAFDKELEKVLGVAAKAETIASRTAKHISEHMEEDPAFYKRLSELIQQTIADYRAKRISDLEYLKRAKELSEQALSRKGDDMPEVLEHKEVAQAFYRQLEEAFVPKTQDEAVRKQLSTESALAIDEIIQKLLRVDWQMHKDIPKKMIHLIGDYLIDEVRDKYDIKMNFEEIDAIAERCVEIAKIRYKQ